MSDEALRAAAVAANPDHPWYDHDDLGDALVPLTDVGDDAWADAAFIAAASPAVVLALLERVRRVEALCEEWQSLTLPGMTDWDRADDVRQALTGHPARSGGAERDAGGEVAESDGGEVLGAQAGCEHGWTRRGDRGDKWSQCWLCGEVRSGWTADDVGDEREGGCP